ncbi:unnamed protein product [Closterium sp. NIES-53]
MYLMTCTRPDLAYPLSILARYVAPGRHRPEHMAAAKSVLRYLCSTSGMGLVLGGRSPVVLTGHADASWADDQATQRSSQGYTFGLGSGSVSWRATRSSSVLGSSCEAEIYARAMAAQELRWLTYLLTDLGEPPRSPPVLYVDNKAMLALCREQRLEHRTKHIALRYFLARELQQRGQLRLAYVASEANTADVFTKALAPCDNQRCCTQLGLLCFVLLDWSCDPLFSPTLPMGAITSKWLFKIKSDANGKIERYKSRLVAKGYQQKEKVDYKELFAPVVNPTTLRTLLAMKKALYGLKQAPRQWYLKLRGVLEETGFTPSSADHSLFMLGEGEQRSFMVVYVDDILIFSPSSDLVKEVMVKLQDKFKCKALGDVSSYLGLHIERDVEKRCMRVHQRKYLEALAATFGHSKGHVATPFPSGFKCMKGPEEESVGEEERRRFHSLVGSLMYAAVNTRPDVAFATGQLARGTDGVEPGRLFLTAFSDASYASQPEDMTSVGGFICCVGGGPTAWESKKQVDQALSSVESEYMALFRAVREIVWQRRLLAELGEEQQGPTPLYCDSQGAIALAKNPVLHGLTKHMRVKWHWMRSMVAAGEVELHYVKTTGQPADMMIKRLVEQQHWKCCKLAGMALN